MTTYLLLCSIFLLGRAFIYAKDGKPTFKRTCQAVAMELLSLCAIFQLDLAAYCLMATLIVLALSSLWFEPANDPEVTDRRRFQPRLIALLLRNALYHNPRRPIRCENSLAQPIHLLRQPRHHRTGIVTDSRTTIVGLDDRSAAKYRGSQWLASPAAGHLQYSAAKTSRRSGAL
jgi:predicted membrane metal-binding protein